MTFKTGVAALMLSCSLATPCAANPCAGKGTKIVFVNGLINDLAMATKTVTDFERFTRPSLPQIKNLKYELAWVEGRNIYLQLALAVVERGADDFQRFWLWLEGIDRAPEWFEVLTKKLTMAAGLLSASTLPRLEEHLEQYSRAIVEGYNLVIVSHSAGNFYANAALRALPDYVPLALQPSILDRRRNNPFYPKPEEIISNIQLASPAAATVNGAPWINFKDDEVLRWIPEAGRLPGNVDILGSGPEDLRGHSFLPAYMKNEPIRKLIVQYIQSAHSKMKYPIPLFQNAATLRYRSIVEGKSTPAFFAEFKLNGREITKTDEKENGKSGRFEYFSAACFDLRPGQVAIQSETILSGSNGKEFNVSAFQGKTGDRQELKMIQRREIERWSLGQIKVSEGSGPEPLDVQVQFLNPPQSRQ